MKKILILASFIATLVACKSTPEGYVVTGTITGELKDSTQVFLKKLDARKQPIDLDTAFVKNGEFIFKGVANDLELRFVFIDKAQGYISFITENGEININAQKDSLGFANVEGTIQNDIYGDFNDNMRALTNKYTSINKDYRNAKNSNDAATAEALEDELKELIEERKDFEKSFVKENPNALISAFLLQSMLASKVFPEEEVKSMFDAFTPEIKATEPGKEIQKIIEKGKAVAVGSKAPNFSAPTPTGEKLALYDVLGKITIIDFWAAWCKPCRAENPNVVKLYNKYHEKGLNILGVSFDKTPGAWKKAIEDDGLIWDHVSNVQYFDEIAKLYNLNAIPATVILDEKGIILAKNLRGAALEEKIASLLQ